MLDTATSAPAVTGWLTWLVISAAAAVGILYASLAAVQLIAPAQPARRPPLHPHQRLRHRDPVRRSAAGHLVRRLAAGPPPPGIQPVGHVRDHRRECLRARHGSVRDQLSRHSSPRSGNPGLHPAARHRTVANRRAADGDRHHTHPGAAGCRRPGVRGGTASRNGAGQVRSAGPGRPVGRGRGSAGRPPAPPSRQLRHVSRGRLTQARTPPRRSPLRDRACSSPPRPASTVNFLLGFCGHVSRRPGWLRLTGVGGHRAAPPVGAGMTKVTAQMSVSLDGYYAGPRSSTDPHAWRPG